jgi:hypothetical protein
MEKEQNKKEIGPLIDQYTFSEVLEMVKIERKTEEISESWGPDEKESERLMEWKDLNKLQFPSQPWRINNLIPKEGSVIISSISGERKTWFALEMARCLSMGLPFLEEEMFKTEGCNVLYIDCENSLSELKRRCKQLGFEEDGPFKLYLFNGSDMNFSSEEGSAWLHAMIQYVGAKIVFVDTFRSVAGGLKEEKAEEIRTFFGKFRSLKDQGVTVIWLDHFRKPSNFEKKIPQKEHLLGSQDKTAGVEVLLMLRSESGSTELDVYQRKNRLSKEVEPFKIEMDDWFDDEDQLRTFLKYEGVIDEKETQKEEAKKYILELLSSESGLVTKEIVGAVQEERKIGERNIRDALKELVSSDKLDVGKNGRQNYYFLPKETKDIEEPKDIP